MLDFCPTFSMQFFSCFAIRGIGFFGRSKAAEVMPISVQFYSCDPSISFCYKSDTFISGSIIFLRSSIAVILRGCCVSQIFPTVVALVFVDMINFVFRPFSFYIKPREAMGHILIAIYSYFYSTFCAFKTGLFSNDGSFRKGYSPRKNSSGFVINENAADIIARQVLQRIFVSALHSLRLISGAVIVKGTA